MKRAFLICALVSGLVAPAAAQASSIDWNCGTCGNHNTSFDVTYSLLNPATNTYQLLITATYQPAGAGVPDFTYINSLAFKLGNVSYDSTPTLNSGPVEDLWALMPGGLAAGGCTGSGAGFYCAYASGFGATHGAAGTTDTWVFTFDVAGNNPLPSTLGLTLKGYFTNADGTKVGSILSNEGTAFEITNEPGCEGGPCAPAPVPEPASLVLLGTGLAMGAAALRRTRRKNQQATITDSNDGN